MSPSSTLQSTLHALFLLTPFKYSHSRQIRMPKTTLAPLAEEKTDGGGDGKTPGGGTTTARDDGELGGIALGIEVWDDYEHERELKVWEATEAAQEANASSSRVPSASL
jgi:hypothetical protein